MRQPSQPALGGGVGGVLARPRRRGERRPAPRAGAEHASARGCPKQTAGPAYGAQPHDAAPSAQAAVMERGGRKPVLCGEAHVSESWQGTMRHRAHEYANPSAGYLWSRRASLGGGNNVSESVHPAKHVENLHLEPPAWNKIAVNWAQSQQTAGDLRLPWGGHGGHVRMSWAYRICDAHNIAGPAVLNCGLYASWLTMKPEAVFLRLLQHNSHAASPPHTAAVPTTETTTATATFQATPHFCN
jgi:hypothetical protein